MGVVFRKMKIRGLHDQVVVLLAAMRCEIPDGCSANLTLPNYGRVARHSGAVQRSDPMYALPAKAATFRRARRFLPALAAIRIPARAYSQRSPPGCPGQHLG